ncbi:3-oxoacyl-[acyl-carrier-protein] reductase [Kiritimatiellaeota bacterium B1221]|nr:3-oxoacyl-[acyl-carrier-protein] reductase [Kiritimatiellaeota bacterium B1221]
MLEGKIALVTGAARGIGQEIALKLAAEGADLALCDVKTEWLDETKAKVEALGRRAEAYGVDVSNGEQVTAGVGQVNKDFGRIDIVVNNAGITRDGLLMRMSEEDWDLVMNINLKGTFLMTKAASRFMMKQRSGVFVNIASVIGLMGNPGQANYGASKAGVSNLTKTTAKELAARGIRANAIAPGFIKTKMTDALTDEVRDAMLAVIPMKDFGTPEDVANTVLFLASDLSRYVTGQTLSVCGGMVTS